MEKVFDGRPHQKMTDASRFAAAVMLYFDVPVDAVHEASSDNLCENWLSSRPSCHLTNIFKAGTHSCKSQDDLRLT
ncbi:unnamed protein product [Protopolystoma xenopodis]|uniref:Uncharacterized protein n=1 Tax=Protopolystoma xenopodis TaxID=117903 RepID=A0A3S5AZ00_9PLAT|nr:unnamed protein product [Protopolystoma xenopodis]